MFASASSLHRFGGFVVIAKLKGEGHELFRLHFDGDAI